MARLEKHYGPFNSRREPGHTSKRLKDMGKEASSDRYVDLLFVILIFTGLYLVSLYNSILFNNLAEMLSVIIAFGVFMVAWNNHSIIDNDYLLFLGISFLFVGGLELLRTVFLINTGVLEEHRSMNLAAGLHISAGYLQSTSFLVAFFLMKRSLRLPSIFFLYAVITAAILMTVFHWRFSTQGLGEVIGIRDPGKIDAVIISAIVAAAIALLISRKRDFDPRVLVLLIASLVAGVFTETASVLRKNPGGLMDVAGHLTPVLSLCFIYAAIMRSRYVDTCHLLFRGLKHDERVLEEARNTAGKCFGMAGVMLLGTNSEGIVVLANEKVCNFLGYTEKEILGRNWFDTFLPEQIRNENKEVFSRMMEGDAASTCYHQDEILTRGGEERIIAWHDTAIGDRSGKNIGRLSSGFDITRTKETEKRLEESDSRLRAITLALGEGVYILDMTGRMIFMNHEAETILGWKERELIGRNVHTLVHAHRTTGIILTSEECPIMETVNSGNICRSAEEIFIRKDGTPFPVTLVSTPVINNGKITGSVVAFRDITGRKRTEEALRRANELLTHQATTDTLTGIYNRLKFNGLLDMELRKARRYKLPFALIMFDIDYFKNINDEYGHPAGDQVLKEVAELVGQNIRDADLFARWGGEEFMILAPENDLRNAFQLAEKLRMKIEAHRFSDVGKITCSFGVTEFSEGDAVSTLAGRVDDAMYNAKRKGRNRTESR